MLPERVVRTAKIFAPAGFVLYSGAFGMADFELSVSNTPATRFMIGSVSKQFTAAAVLLLEDEGKLSVDDPISKFISHERGEEITIHYGPAWVVDE